MNRSLPLLALVLGVAAPVWPQAGPPAAGVPLSASDAPRARRFALVAGANEGSADRARLRFAVLDAERFAAVAQQLGGVEAADCVLLREPTRRGLLEALAALRERVTEARGSAQRTEVLFYFSGHADDSGLLLGREQLGYLELREILADMPSDVRIAVLDACASGAITRLKGGHTHPAFLSDVSTQVRGHAFLTSSSESEAAQESDRLRGSYFTQALLSGMRGAADVSGDSRVTLGEAYQFAFQETMARTASTEGGTQHPSYDMKMAGTGDVVLTDLRQTSATVVLGPDFDGRFFVRDAEGHLVAELGKPGGRTVELGVEPGEYEIAFEQPSALLRTRISVVDGQRRELARGEMKPGPRQWTRRRGAPSADVDGGPAGDAWLRGGRSRLEIAGGASDLRVRSVTTSTGSSDSVSGGNFELGYSYFVRPNVTVDLSAVGQDLDVSTKAGATGTDESTTGSWGAFAGARAYAPLPGSVRPFVLGGLGFLTDFTTVETPLSTTVEQSDTDFAFRVGGGAEVRLGQHANLTLRLMLTRRAGDSAYCGAFGFGWAFGHGR